MSERALPADFDQNDEGIPKQHLIRMLLDYGMKPGINMALFIASGSLGRKTTWTGTDYGEHYLRVSGIGLGDFVSENEKIIGILHDVIEDSDWEVEDLEMLGFSPIICEGVRSVTKIPDEKYLDASKRASINELGRRVKMRDNRDNMDLTRSTHAATDKQKYLYHISYTYLRAVEDKEIPADYSIWKFLRIEKFAGLLTRENAGIIARATIEPPPQDIATKFNLLAVTPVAAPAP